MLQMAPPCSGASVLIKLSAPDCAIGRLQGYHKSARLCVRVHRRLRFRQLSPQFEPNTPFYQPPGFAYLLTAIQATIGRDPTAGRWVLAVMGALTALFACRIATRLYRPRTGLIAGVLTAAYGPLLFYNLQWLPAGLAALLNTILLWLLLEAVARDRAVTWLVRRRLRGPGGGDGAQRVSVHAAGSGLAAVRAVGPRRPGRGQDASGLRRVGGVGLAVGARTALVAIGTLAAIAPVTVKNYRASGRFALISHNGGLNFYIGNNPESDDTIAIRPGFAWERLDKLPMRAGVFHAVDADRYYYRQGRHAEALDLLSHAITLDITVEEAYGLLAWILATAPDAELRDGERALASIRFLIRWRGDRDPMRIDALAAAYAETGQFDAAVHYGTQAVTRWRATGREDVAQQAETRLAHYQRGIPFRETADGF